MSNYILISISISIFKNQVRITKIRLARSMSNTLRREEDHLLKYQHAQQLKEAKKESKRKSRMKIDKNAKNDKNERDERKEESSATSHQLPFPPFFKQLTDPISNFRPSQLQLQLQLQLPNIGSIMNYRKSKSAKYSYVEEKETDYEINNEMASNSCYSNKASCGSISISRLPNLSNSNSNYSMSSATDSEHSSTPSSPTLFEREKRQNIRANLPPSSPSSPFSPSSCNRTNTTQILKSNTNVSDVVLQSNDNNNNDNDNDNDNNNDNDNDNQINLVDHIDIDIHIKNNNYAKELDKSEKVNEFIARQKAFEKNERNESIRRSHARRYGVSSRSIEIAIDELNLGIDNNNRKGREYSKINNQINNNNDNNKNTKKSCNNNNNNLNNYTYDYYGNNSDNVDDNNSFVTLQEALNSENPHNQNGKRYGQIRIKKPFYSFSVSSHPYDSAENKHYHHNHLLQNNHNNDNDNDNDNSNQNNQELLKNNNEIKSRQEYPANSKCRFMDQNNSRSNLNRQNSNMILPPIRIHTAPSLLYNTSHSASFFTPPLPLTPLTPPLPLTHILTQNPNERGEIREPEQPVKIAMISKSRRSFLNNSGINNKNKNNNTNKKGNENNNNNTDTYSNNNTAQSIQQSNLNTDISINKKTSLGSMQSITRDTLTISFPASPNGPHLISHDRRLELSSQQFGADSITDSFYHASITPLKTNSSCVASPVMSPVASPLSRSKFRST